MKRNSIIRFVGRIVGLIILILGLRMMVEGPLNYVEQRKQTDWIETRAEIIDISSRTEHYGARNRKSRTVYDITFQYEANGTVYTDEFVNHSTIRMVGDGIAIKYNPDAPENSTTTLSPSISDLLVFVIFGVLFATLGFFLSGLFALIRKIIRMGNPEEEEILPPEEYTRTD